MHDRDAHQDEATEEDREPEEHPPALAAKRDRDLHRAEDDGDEPERGEDRARGEPPCASHRGGNPRRGFGGSPPLSGGFKAEKRPTASPMMAPSHLLATLILGFLLAKVVPWDARAWLLALAFGVAIDLDHLLELPRYLAAEVPAKGWAALAPSALLAHGAAWQGVFHQPLGAVLVLAASLAFRSPVPLVFWGLHMVLDFVVARHYVRFGGPVEWGLVAAGAVALALLALGHHRTVAPTVPFGAWARAAATAVLLPR